MPGRITRQSSGHKNAEDGSLPLVPHVKNRLQSSSANVELCTNNQLFLQFKWPICAQTVIFQQIKENHPCDHGRLAQRWL